MKQSTIIAVTMLISMSARSVVVPVEPSFSTAFLEEEGERKRIILKFIPEVPPYGVHYYNDKRMSEIRWKAVATDSISKNYIFNDEQSDIKRVLITIDAKNGRGVMRIWHNSSNTYSISKRGGGDLILHVREEAPARKAAALPTRDSKYKHKEVTLNVRKAPLDKLLRNLAAENQKSLSFGNEVTGNVTVNLKNMPYEDVIDTILKPTQYRAEHNGEVTIIRSAKDGRSFRAFKLKYVDVNLILKTVQDIISKDGQVSVDANSNSIFVGDKVEILMHVEQMLAVLDQEPRQVEVEAAIVDLENNDSTSVGFDIAGDIHNGEVSNDIRSTRISPFDPAATAPKGMFVGLTWRSVRGILGMLSSRSKLSVLARPRVLALSDQEASIVIGSKIGYKTLTVTTTGTVQDVKFLTVGTQLKIKPHITQNGNILMSIRPEVSDGAVDSTTGLPTENTTSSETKVLSRNGQTIVIGGLLRDRAEKKVDKIPILGDIPLIGFFFRGTTVNTQKSEIVILLSPKLVTNQVQAEHEREAISSVDRFYDNSGMTRKR